MIKEKTTKEKKFVSVREVADHFEISPDTVKNLMKAGDLKGFQIGKQYKITKESFDALIEKTST